MSSVNNRSLVRSGGTKALAFALLFAAVMSMMPSTAKAGAAVTRTWDGGGGDSNWTTPANWVGDVAPSAGDDLVFPAAGAQQTNVNNFAANTAFGSISITGGSYSISGNAINLGATGIALTSGTSTISLNVAITAHSNVDVSAGATLTLSGVLSGTRRISVNESGTLILSGTNTYSGGTRLFGGTVILANDACFGTGTVSIQNNNTVTLQDNGSARTIANRIDPNGTLNLTVNNAINFSGLIGGNGEINKNGTATLTYSGTQANTFGGTTTINVGTLSLAKTGVAALAGTVVIGDGTGVDSVICTTAGQLAATLNVDLSANGVLTSTGFDATINSLNNDAGSTFTVANLTIGGGTSVVNGAFTSTGNLLKTGGGSLTFTTNTSTWTGTTTVDGGSLIVNANYSSKAISVTGAGILGGSGPVGAVTVATGGTVNPGVAATNGTLTTGAVTFDSASFLTIALDNISDLLATSTVDLGGSTLNLTLANSTIGEVYTIVTGTVTGTFGNYANNALINVGGRTLKIVYSSTDVKLTDVTAPNILSIVRADANPTNQATVNYTVTFDQDVAPVDVSDFSLLFGQQGLKGEYFNNTNYSGTPVLTRVDGPIDFNFGGGSPDPAVNSDLFSARWSGFIIPSETGNFSFQTATDDPVRLEINGVEVLNTSIGTYTVGPFSLVAGQPISVVFQFAEFFGGAEAHLRWSPPSAMGGFSVIPAANLATGVFTSNPFIVGVTGSGSVYNVAVNTGNGQGSIQLNLNDNDSSILNVAGGLPLTTTTFSGPAYDFDNVGPTITVDAQTTNDDTPTVTGTLPLAGATSVSVTVNGNTYAATITNGGYAWTVDITDPLPQNTTGYNVIATATDAAGNTATDATNNELKIDLLPTVVSINRVGSTPTNLLSVDYTVTFSEDVTGVDTADFSVDFPVTGDLGAGTVSNVSAVSGSVYTVTVTYTGTNGSVRLNYGTGTPSVQDSTGNMVLGVFNGEVYDVDLVAPTVLSINRVNGTPTSASSLVWTVTFSEDVQNVDADGSDFQAVFTGGLALDTISVVQVSPSTYTVTVTYTGASGTVGLNTNGTPSVSDIAGNALTAAFTGEVYTVDTVAPFVVDVTKDGGEANPATDGSVNFFVEFSEVVSGVDASDFVVDPSGVFGATVTNVSTTDNITYTVTVTWVTGDGTLGLNVANNGSIKDTAGIALDDVFNTGATYDIDSTPRLLSINRAGTNPTNAASVDYTVTFSEDVTNVTSDDFTVLLTGTLAGTPTIGVSGTGDVYTVTVGGYGAGDGTVQLNLNAGTDIAGSGGALVVNGGNGQIYTIDASNPDVTITSGAGNPTTSPFTVTITFSEAVTGFDVSDILTTNANLSTFTQVSPSVYTVSVTAIADGLVSLNVLAGVATDIAGNPNNQAAQFTRTVDDTEPTVAITSTTSSPTIQTSIPVTVTFSEDVNGFNRNDLHIKLNGGPDLQVNGANSVISGFTNVSPGVYTFTLNFTTFGTYTIDINAGAASDNAGNGNLAAPQFSIVYTNGTTVTIAAVTGSPTNATTIDFTATFSDAVTDFDVTDVTLTAPAGSSAQVIPVSGTVYTIRVTGMTADGTVSVQIPAGAATTGASGPSVASNTASVVFDGTRPTVTINQGSGQADPTGASPIVFDVVFSEAVALTPANITLGGTAGTLSATVSPNSGTSTTYTVSVTGMSQDGTVTASIAANAITDAAGNGNFASTSTDNTVTFTLTGPSVTINQASGQNDPTNNGAIQFTVVFSASVTGFAANDVALSGTATASVTNVSGSGTTYTVTVTATSAGTVIATVPAGGAVDGLNNANAASSSTDNTVTFDNVAPVPTIDLAAGQQDPTTVGTINFSVVFSEDVGTSFVSSDVTVGGTAGATTAVVTGSGTTYNVRVTGMTGAGTVTINIAAGTATDAVGNTSGAAVITDNSVDYTPAPPTVVVSLATGQADPSNATTVNFTVLFSEAVTGFDNTDVTLGGTAGATGAVVTEVAPNDGTTYNVAVTGMTADGTVTVSIPASAATSTASLQSLASNTATLTVDYSVPVITGSGIIPSTTTGTVGTPVTFMVGTTETTGLTYTWNFGDGSSQTTTTGAVDHTYTLAGTYTVTVTVTDAAGNSTTSSMSFTVNAAGGGGTPDDICAGLNPIAMTTPALSAKLKFPGTLLKDSISFKAVIQLNNGFNLLGQELKWDLAGIRGQLTFDTVKGAAPKSTTVKAKISFKKPKKGEAFTARPGKISISLRGQNLTDLKLAGVTTLNTTTPKTGSAGTAHICVVLTNHQAYEVDKAGIYKAKQGKTGSYKTNK